MSKWHILNLRSFYEWVAIFQTLLFLETPIHVYVWAKLLPIYILHIMIPYI